ncbi:hypothetical protein [Streptomyces sp. NPDC003635]
MTDGRYQKYIKHVRADVGMEPTWPPAAERVLGDVGRLRNGRFERRGTLETLFGLRVTPRPVKENSSVFRSDSKGTVQVHHNTAIGAGAALVAADGSVVLEFGKADSVFFQATGCRTEEIDRIDLVEELMAERHSKGDWPRGQVVITEVTHAASTTAIMCNRRNDRVALRAAADAPAAGLDLLTASGSLQWAGGSAASLQVVSEGELTPLYRAWGMVRHVFGDDEPSFLDKDTDTETDEEDQDVERYPDQVSSLEFDDLS